MSNVNARLAKRGFGKMPISFPESSLPLSNGGTANKDLWDRVIRLTCAVRQEVQESWRPLVETWGPVMADRFPPELLVGRSTARQG